MLYHAGYKEIKLFPGGFHLDQREAGELKKMISYWKELMKSAAPGMITSGIILSQDVLEMEGDLESIAEDENAVFSYQFIQAEATL